MQQTCKKCGTKFEFADQDRELFLKLDVPLPTLCSEDLHKRKMAFRNERSLYKRQCALCKKEVISMYAPSIPYTIFCNACWWGDGWDPMEYGRPFDFNKPFFEQFNEITKKVPKYALDNFDYENAEYCNFSCHNKDCYMLFGSGFNEKSMYGNTILYGLEMLDSLYCNECRYGYELIDCEKCYELFYAQNCSACSKSYFLFDCKNCSNCVFCWNLRNKNYHIFNKPVSQEVFDRAVAKRTPISFTIADVDKYRNLVEKEAIHKFAIVENCENSSGNFLYRCKNTQDVFYAIEVEDVSHSVRTMHQKDSMYINGCSYGELMYDSIHCDYCHRGKFNLSGDHNSDFMYCWNCYQCEHCFGCMSLRHKSYCILNKQYSHEEYFELVGRIIEYMKQTGEWGEFFPMEMSPFKYEETVAQEFYPQETSVVPSAKDGACIECGKNFRIIDQELQFYKKYNLPTPQKCFGCRHLARMKLRAPYKTFDRLCSKCGKALRSSYAPERSEKIYCEECYLKEVY